MTATGRTATRVLAAVVALQLVAETALTPYWPQLLEELFGEDQLAATGAYLTACRLAGLLALPAWGLAARRWPLPRLLVVSLAGCAVLDLALALAPTLLLFTLASAGVVATGSALVFAYPALVAVADRSEGGDRLRAVLVGVAVFHAASLLATVVGAGILALPSPRTGLAAFAVVDLVLAVLVWRTVAAVEEPTAAGTLNGPAGTRDDGTRHAGTPDDETRLDGSRHELTGHDRAGHDRAGHDGSRTRGGRARSPLLALPLVLLLLTAVLSDLGTGVPRPFFTTLVLETGGSLTLAAVLFLLPSAGALGSLLAARRLQEQLGARLLPAACVLAAAGLALQAVAPEAVASMVLGRLALGAGLGLLAVAIDLRVFASVGTGGAGFAVVETARSTALLLSPALATVTAGLDLALPLAAGAALLLVAAGCSLVRSPAPSTPPQEAPRALEPVH